MLWWIASETITVASCEISDVIYVVVSRLYSCIWCKLLGIRNLVSK